MLANSVDKIDYLILKSLLEDGRMSYSAIAKDTKLTDVAIKKRIESLKRRNILNSVKADINLQALGYENPLLLQIRSEVAKTNDLVKKLERFDFVTEVYKVLGEYNLFAKVVLPKIGNADELLSKLGLLDGVLDIKTMVVINKAKSSDSLPTTILQKKL